MIKATQNAILQETLISQIDLRSQELEFTTMILGVIGITSSFICTNLVNAIDNVALDMYDDTIQSPAWFYFFWVTLSIGFVLSVLLVSKCVFGSIIGQVMALRGPPGSMSLALNLLSTEKHDILKLFTLVVCFMTLNMIAVFWTVSANWGAVAPTFIILVSTYFWIRNCRAIYERFRFDFEESMMLDNKKTLEYTFFPRFSHESRLKETFFSSAPTSTSSSTPLLSNPSPSSSHSIYSHFPLISSSSSSSSISYLPRIQHSGYLHMKIQYRPPTFPLSSSSSSSTWINFLKNNTHNKHNNHNNNNTRLNGILLRYVVIRDTSLFYYSSRQDYEDTPHLPLRRRPFSLDEYRLRLIEPSRSSSSSLSSSHENKKK